MNLTSKRLVQFVAGCASLCVLTASATDYVSDSFESGGDGLTNGVSGMPIGQYKSIPSQDGNSTSYVWQAQSGDASCLTNIDNSSFSGGEFRPITNATHDLVLNLATEGQTLTRALDGNATNDFYNNGPYYVDSLIQFTPSEDNPTISDSSVKAALFVNASSNLCVYHSYTPDGGGTFVATNSDLNVHIDPTSWYRVTIKLGQIPEAGGKTGYQLFLNGMLVTNDAAIDETASHPGTWFVNPATSLDATLLSSVSFQGTGMIDELVVTDSPAPFSSATPTGVLLTLAFDPTKLFVSVDGSTVNSNDTVVSGSTLVMNTVDWYQINSITGDGVTYDNVDGTIGAALCTNSATTVHADAAGRTATIAVGLFSGWPEGSGTYTNYPMSQVATWASMHGVSVSDAYANMGSYLDDYLFNVDPGTDPKLVIASISVDNNNNQYTVVVTNTLNAAFSDVGSRGGKLFYETTDSLSQNFGGTTNVDITATGSVSTNTISMPGSSVFIKFFVQ